MDKTSFNFVFFSCPVVAKEPNPYIAFGVSFVVDKASIGCFLIVLYLFFLFIYYVFINAHEAFFCKS